ncbi:MAG: transglutaminase domain-containing protein [Oscillospiraceae bacterium]|nr:transglutaminase domain-containing protein [Oscillospiraceae bacterium]
MKKTAALLLALCLLLSGCSTLFDGSYSHEEPHTNQGGQLPHENIIASNYDGLCKALAGLVESGSQSGIISVPNYDQSTIYTDLNQAVNQVRTTNPIAAWAVNDIQCELGSNGGQLSVAVTVTYLHDRSEIRKVHRVSTMEGAKNVIAGVLDDHGTGVQLLIPNYSATDFQQLVDNYVDTHPQSVMEHPHVVANIFPETGTSRLVELKFTCQNSRDALRAMQKQVQTVFESAAVYVSSYSKESEKFEQLYAFLMEFLVEGDYLLETSITPAYSLLRHGVGDKKAFATVYAAMCREAGLDCQIVTGTRNGVPWIWNLVKVDGAYRHLDLLRCSERGGYTTYLDSQMEGYVWDYSGYPASE